MEFKHDAWTIEQGAPSRINAITQTRDGYLWIGSVEGLFRFDGVSFEPIRLEGDQGQRLVVSSLLATRSGDLWVGLGRGRGVARWRDGRLVDARMPNPSREVNDLQEDPQGGIWVARGGRSTGMLARFHDGRWEEPGPETGLPAQPVWQLHFGRDGRLRVVLSGALAVADFTQHSNTTGQANQASQATLKTLRFQLVETGLSPRASLTEDTHGQLWLSDANGLRALQRSASPDTAFRYPNPVGGSRLIFDRQGDLWTTTFNSGVLRIQAPGHPLTSARKDARRIASLQASAGLTSDQTRALFQDREGNVWVGTELGLDLLRPASVVADPDLPANSPTSYRLAVTRDGVVYVADASGLYAIAPGERPRRVMALESPAEALCDAGERGVWLFLADRVLKVDPDRVTRLAKPVRGTAYGCAEDQEGRLWMPGLDQGLHWWQDGHWQRWPEALPSASLPANAARDRGGRVAVVFRGPPPSGDTPFLALDMSRSAVGGIEGLLPSQAGLLISGSLGLGPAIATPPGSPPHDALKPPPALANPANPATPSAASSASARSSALPNGPLALALPASAHPWAASVNGLTQTPAGDTWLIGDAGIVRLRTADLQAALQQPGAALPYRVFDFKDGLNSFVQKAPGAQVVTGADGRVWFLTRRNVQRIDPATLAPNPLPPPVLVRAVQAGDDTFAAGSSLTLPAGTTTVRIDFTALSFPVPSRVRFRHRLVGAEQERWSEPRPDRSIVLQDLKPGRYRFEVMASNNDGLWNPQPAQLALSIPATFTQSLVFKLAVAGAVGLLLYSLYLMRIRRILARLRERSEDRSRERERIARDIHDTLLQSVQGLILRFHAVVGRMQHEPALQQSLHQALDRAEAVVVEGRDRLQGLRRASGSDLEQELRLLVQEKPFCAGTQVNVSSSGPHRRLRPHVFDEVLCITGEALFNAARHARASDVAVHIDYGRHWFTVQVHDNGIGMVRTGKDGHSSHFGLLGMKERAARVSAELDINGQARPGTQVSLRIKARIAYARDTG
ncbi:sensor histidine kinase [Roseateles depolymerans]|uniref:Histidine kinase n=1 Tax=Roseateles depolymerans TaxID=76731 RepID=A0A0U3MVZ1_9BURK|nr:sensor histidine kinase [Roseateles depolymerans]ALV08538.1 Histidine kinase [Roseateles depolymerans]REG21236.1 two component regulator with propeller domain [Roseateles depolymerans]